MHVSASSSLLGKPEPGVDLQFYSPDQKRAQRLSARLRNFATVHWIDRGPSALTDELPPATSSGLVLLDYSLDAAEESSTLARRLIVHAPDSPLVGVGSTGMDRATGVLAALRAGVRDFLDLDATDEELRHLLARVQSQAELARMARTRTIPVRAPGQVVVVLGVRPGVGTSTLVAHLGALAMASGPEPAKSEAGEASSQVLLLDLGRPFGDVALYLGVDGDFHYDDALRSARRIDPILIRTALAHHSSGLALLSQAAEASGTQAVDAEAGMLIDRLRDHFGLLLCDLGGLPVGAAPLPLLRSAGQIWLVADQGIGSLVSLDATLRELERLGLRDGRLSLIINRYGEYEGASAAQLADRFKLPLLATLPERTRALRGCTNRGQLLHQIASRDPYVRALRPLLEKMQVGSAGTPALTGWKRLLPHLGGFRWTTR